MLNTTMQRFLFIDRDGTIIVEPPEDFQVDSYEKLAFLPKVIRNLYQITQELNYEFVMVTNQDGLGTDSFPESTFWGVHNKMLEILEQEGVSFREILIDRSFEHEQAPTRKPRTGLLGEYIAHPHFDLSNSFVIGDRLSDMELAYNLGARGILIGDPSQDLEFPKPEVEEVIELITTDWDEIYQFLSFEESLFAAANRQAEVQRKTNETDIKVNLNLDGEGKRQISTGIGFLDHMLDQVAKHGNLDLELSCKGDLHIDAHHTIEDVALALGEAFRKALGNKRGIERYGFYILPMDETLAQVAIDFSGRPYLVWQDALRTPQVGQFPCEMVKHFFKSFSDQAACNLNVSVSGENDHHQIEAVFKAFARAIKMAVARDANNQDLPSTKGML